MKTLYCYAGAPKVSSSDVELLIEGRARVLTPLGTALPHRLTGATRPLYDTARARGWLEMPKLLPAVRNAWWVYCEAHDHPYIFTRGAGRLTEVHMDLLNFKGGRPLPGLFEEVRELCRRVSARKQWCAGHFTQVFVAPAAAPATAATLVRLALAAR